MLSSMFTCPTYHHVGDTVPAEACHLGVWTRTSDFLAHLNHFETNYDIVDLETLLHHRWPRRPLLLTFDDSYRSLADTVAPILKRRGLPGVVFLNPDMIDQPAMMFDHVLSALAERFGHQRVLDEIGPKAASCGSIQACLNSPDMHLAPADRSALQRRLIDAFGLAEAQLHNDSGVYLRPADVTTLVEAGLEVGNHTASHARCRTLTADDMATELIGAQARLAALSRRPVRAFSIPYGSRLDATPAVVAALHGSGHEAIFLADGRLSRRNASGPQLWDRVSMDGVEAGAVRVHLELRPRLRGAKDVARGLVRRFGGTPSQRSRRSSPLST